MTEATRRRNKKSLIICRITSFMGSSLIQSLQILSEKKRRLKSNTMRKIILSMNHSSSQQLISSSNKWPMKTEFKSFMLFIIIKSSIHLFKSINFSHSSTLYLITPISKNQVSWKPLATTLTRDGRITPTTVLSSTLFKEWQLSS